MARLVFSSVTEIVCKQFQGFPVKTQVSKYDPAGVLFLFWSAARLCNSICVFLTQVDDSVSALTYESDTETVSVLWFIVWFPVLTRSQARLPLCVVTSLIWSPLLGLRQLVPVPFMGIAHHVCFSDFLRAIEFWGHPLYLVPTAHVVFNSNKSRKTPSIVVIINKIC